MAAPATVPVCIVNPIMIAGPPATVLARIILVIARGSPQTGQKEQMLISMEQLQLIVRLLNLLGVHALDADIIIERKAKIQLKTADDHAICRRRGQKATVFYGQGVRLRLRHLQVFNRWVYLYLLPKSLRCPHYNDRPTTTRLDDLYHGQSGMTRAFPENLLLEIKPSEAI